jgi:hypothetical protein
VCPVSFFKDRHHPRKRVIQYSKDSGGGTDKPASTRSPAFAEDDIELATPATARRFYLTIPASFLIAALIGAAASS